MKVRFRSLIFKKMTNKFGQSGLANVACHRREKKVPSGLTEAGRDTDRFKREGAKGSRGLSCTVAGCGKSEKQQLFFRGDFPDYLNDRIVECYPAHFTNT